MLQRFLYGLAWGAGVTLPVILGIVLLVVILEFGEDYFDDQSFVYEPIVDFEIIKPSHRIIEGAKYDNGLLITGEIKIEPSAYKSKYDYLYIKALLRNQNGGYIESCSSAINTENIKIDVIRFGITCERIKQLQDFENYSFSLEGRFEE